MARWRFCDEDFYWFVAFETDEVDENQKAINKEIGNETRSQMNLWRCRHCAAMIPGDGRLEHQKFHERVGK